MLRQTLLFFIFSSPTFAIFFPSALVLVFFRVEWRGENGIGRNEMRDREGKEIRWWCIQGAFEKFLATYRFCFSKCLQEPQQQQQQQPQQRCTPTDGKPPLPPQRVSLTFQSPLYLSTLSLLSLLSSSSTPLPSAVQIIKLKFFSLLHQLQHHHHYYSFYNLYYFIVSPFFFLFYSFFLPFCSTGLANS